MSRRAGLSPPALAVVALAVVFCVAAQYHWWWWYIEDAAISFAYARNVAEGWGLVRFPGDERVEGYSNPLWVAWLAGGYLIGFDGFQTSKGLGLLFSGLTVLGVADVARRAHLPSWAAATAAVLLAVNAPFVIWSTSGLENALFGVLLVGGLRATLIEDRGGRPLAWLFWLGLALTRPEGLAYALLGGGWGALLEIRRRGFPVKALLSGLLFAVCFGAYHAVRYDYFAQPLPSTYYAKMGTAPFNPFSWHFYGWQYLGNWFLESAQLWFAPVFFAGMVGLRGWRGWLTLGLTLWLAVVLLVPGVEPFVSWGLTPTWRASPGWIQLRVVSLALIPLLVLGFASYRRGWELRILAWLFLCFGLFFALRSGGDWMRGYRWLSLVAAPTALLFAAGCAAIVERVREHRVFGKTLALALIVAALVPQARLLRDYVPETTPESVYNRVTHYADAMRTLHLESVDILDHDMGAMLYWGPNLGIVRDTRGLADIAFAQNSRDRDFVREYAWEEYPFDFAHGHASTGALVRRQLRLWTDQYVEFPGYGRNTLHTGNYVRKSLFVHPWEGAALPETTFVSRSHTARLHGLEIVAPEVSPGSWLFAEFGLQVERGAVDGLRLLWFLRGADGLVVSWDVPLGMEDWYPVEEWGSDEVFHGRVTLPLSPDLPLGEYQLGVAMVGPQGVVSSGQAAAEPVFMQGERHLDVVVKLVDKRTMGQKASEDVNRAMGEAAAQRCQGAVEAWRDARAHRAASRDWQASVRPGIASAIAECFAAKALTSERAEAVSAMRAAQRWERTNPRVLAAGVKLGTGWFEEGLRARAAGERAEAFAWFRDTIFVDPSNAWARRYTEELRGPGEP